MNSANVTRSIAVADQGMAKPEERQKRLLLEMKDDFARENYVIHLYQRVGKNGIEE